MYSPVEVELRTETVVKSILLVKSIKTEKASLPTEMSAGSPVLDTEVNNIMK